MTRPANGCATRVRLFVIVALGGPLISFFLPPLHQSEAYHHFIDTRTFWGIPNCLNVLSNLPFLIVGLMGLWAVRRRKMFIDAQERAAYAVFFLGACATCFGSGYYHWAPSDATLVWDRLPMTLAFMSLLAAMISERISVRAGARLLWPLIVVGAASVGWWKWTGNLWPYAMAQFFSIFLIAWLLLAFPPRYTRTGDLLIVTGFYALAKAAEALDGPIYSLTHGVVSGHSIKHVVAAGAVYWVLRMLQRRQPTEPAAP